MKPLTSATPHVIIMVGIPGAGKSAFAEHFAKTFQAPIVHYGQLLTATRNDNDAADAVAALLLDELLKTKGTLIYDGPTDTKASRFDIVRLVESQGYKSLLVWVQTESIEAKRRATRKRADEPSLTPDEFDTAIKRFSPPTAAENPVVISGKHTYASQLKIVLKRLAGTQRPETPETPRVRPAARNIIVR